MFIALYIILWCYNKDNRNLLPYYLIIPNIKLDRQNDLRSFLRNQLNTQVAKICLNVKNKINIF